MEKKIIKTDKFYFDLNDKSSYVETIELLEPIGEAKFSLEETYLKYLQLLEEKVISQK